MYSEKDLRLKCGQTGCVLQFSSYFGFRRYLKKIHAPYITSCWPHDTSNSQCLNNETPSTSSQCQNTEVGPSQSTQGYVLQGYVCLHYSLVYQILKLNWRLVAARIR